MLRILLALLIAAGGLALVLIVAAMFFGGSPNQLRYEVYVDGANRIFVNGEPASEDRVYDLARDMTVEFELEQHPASTRRFCFQDRGCQE